MTTATPVTSTKDYGLTKKVTGRVNIEHTAYTPGSDGSDIEATWQTFHAEGPSRASVHTLIDFTRNFGLPMDASIGPNESLKRLLAGRSRDTTTYTASQQQAYMHKQRKKGFTPSANPSG